MNIYLINVSRITTEELEHYRSRLWETRRSRLSRIKNESDRRRCIMAGALLQYAWQREQHQACFPEIGYTDRGKPFFLNSDWHFSLSHSEDYAACALCCGEPVGLDLQRIVEFKSGFTDRFYTERERSWVAAGDSNQEQQKRATMIWCMKESILKRDGSGLRRELNTLDTFHFLTGENAGTGGCAEGQAVHDGAAVRICTAPQGYVLAVCGKAEADTVVISEKNS